MQTEHVLAAVDEWRRRRCRAASGAGFLDLVVQRGVASYLAAPITGSEAMSSQSGLSISERRRTGRSVKGEWDRSGEAGEGFKSGWAHEAGGVAGGRSPA